MGIDTGAVGACHQLALGNPPFLALPLLALLTFTLLLCLGIRFHFYLLHLCPHFSLWFWDTQEKSSFPMEGLRESHGWDSATWDLFFCR